MADIILRPPTQDELDTICTDSWVGSFMDQSCRPRRLASWMWKRAMYSIVKELLSKHRVLVANVAGVDDEVLGWICWETPSDHHGWCLHYCWVKGYAKKSGVEAVMMKAASADIDSRGAQCSFMTPSVRVIMEGLYAS